VPFLYVIISTIWLIFRQLHIFRPGSYLRRVSQ
jgi:hypothetical protein